MKKIQEAPLFVSVRVLGIFTNFQNKTYSENVQNTARFLKYVWPFFIIMQKRVKKEVFRARYYFVHEYIFQISY